MARKAIILSISCVAFFTASLACNAQTFGDVRVVNESRNLTQGAQDPAISKWLMTLPADDDSAERSSAEAGLSGEMLDHNPTGGGLQELITAPRSVEPAERSSAAGSPLMLDPDPIGGEVYHLSRQRKLTRRPARDVTAGVPSLESGTSVGRNARGSTIHGETADPGVVTAGHRAVPLRSRARGIHRTAVSARRTRVSSRPSAAVRTRAALTRAPTPAPATTVQSGDAYPWQPWGWGNAQAPATGAPVTRRPVPAKRARPAVVPAPAQERGLFGSPSNHWQWPY